MAKKKVIPKSIISCPQCGEKTLNKMPEDACQFYWQCPSCKVLLRPNEGDCCVFCSFGDIPCPPVQLSKT